MCGRNQTETIDCADSYYQFDKLSSLNSAIRPRTAKKDNQRTHARAFSLSLLDRSPKFEGAHERHLSQCIHDVRIGALIQQIRGRKGFVGFDGGQKSSFADAVDVVDRSSSLDQ